MNSQQSGRRLLGLLADLGSGLRNIAADALVEISEPLVPALTDALESHDPQMRKMAAVALCRIDPDRFLDLIRAYMEQDILSLHTNNVRQMVLEDCLSYPSVALLQQMIRERTSLTSSDLFYLLGAVYDAETVDSVRHSLDSEAKETRLQAIKDLEALTEPTMAARIGELFDREMTPERILKLSAERSGLPPDIHDVMLELAKDHDEPWLRAPALYALGEIFSKEVQADGGLASTLESSIKRARGLKSSQFRIDALTDDTTTVKKTPHSIDKLNALFGGEATKSLPQGSGKSDSEQTKELPQGSGSTQPDEAPTLAGGATSAPGAVNTKCRSHFTRQEVETVVGFALSDDDADVRCAARAAQRLMNGVNILNVQLPNGENRMPLIERMIVLSKVEFFDGLNADNLRLLATVCDEAIYPADTVIVQEGDPAGTLYVVVTGRVRLERAGARKETSTLIATIDPGGTFGELTLFDNSPHDTTALTSHPTFVLKLAQAPLLTIVRQHPELSLQLVTVLTQRVRTLYDKIADRTPSKSRMIHKIYDQLD